MEATPAASSTSPSSSRPFSMSPSPQSPTDSEQGALQKTRSQPTPVVRGSLPGGAELHGLGYLKSTPKVYAKEDDEYPTWLWRLLDGGKVGEKKVDLAAMTRKQRAKFDRRQERLLKNMPKSIPLHEQSMDLTHPGDDAVTSLRKRQEITKSAREARRNSIRESNFLKAL